MQPLLRSSVEPDVFNIRAQLIFIQVQQKEGERETAKEV